MTHKLNHNILEGVELRLDINGNTVKVFTVPQGKILNIAAVEVAAFDAGKRIEVYAGGTKRLDYTVPAGYTVLVQTTLNDAPEEVR